MGRRRLEESSLELLLDTICNTFGGVMFIAVLVVILLQLTSREAEQQLPSDAQQRAMAEGADQLAEVRQRLQSLRDAKAQQTELLDRYSTAEVKAANSDYEGRKRVRERFESARDANLTENAKQQAVVNTLSGELAELDELLQIAEREHAAAEAALDKAVKLRSRTTRLPMLRPTNKRRAVFFVSMGKLYQVQRLKSGAGFETNAAHVKEVSDGTATAVVPLPAAGIQVHPDQNAAFSSALAHFDPAQHCLTIFVWPDSYVEFGVWRDALVAAGFEYELVPMEIDEKVYLGTSTMNIGAQ